MAAIKPRDPCSLKHCNGAGDEAGVKGDGGDGRETSPEMRPLSLTQTRSSLCICTMIQGNFWYIQKILATGGRRG